MTKLIVLLLILFLSGCATSYQPFERGSGFKEVQLKPNMFRVSYEGGDSAIQSADFVMLRAAELTLEKGFKYFEVVREEAGQLNNFSIDNHYFMYGSRYVQTSELHSTVVIVTYHHAALELFDATYVSEHFREAYGLDELAIR